MPCRQEQRKLQDKQDKSEWTQKLRPADSVLAVDGMAGKVERLVLEKRRTDHGERCGVRSESRRAAGCRQA
jgi:preprotein translocase subunit YajC